MPHKCFQRFDFESSGKILAARSSADCKEYKVDLTAAFRICQKKFKKCPEPFPKQALFFTCL